MQIKSDKISTYYEILDKFQKDQIAGASDVVKKEIVHSIEGLFDVPDYIFVRLEQEVHLAIVALVE